MDSNSFRQGFRHGLPIGLGYFFVSIGFGIFSVNGGLSIGQTLLISMANLTSAGQLAGVQVMFAGGALLEMAITQGIINLRYALMSVALSQKLGESVGLPARMAIAFFNTDEIFAVSASQTFAISKAYMWGLATLPYLGWTLGTMTGAAAGAVMPALLRGGMGILIYGMFIAIIVPPARQSHPIRVAVILSALLSCLLRYAPLLSGISGGFAIVICALSTSIFCAIRYPHKERD